MAKIRKNGNLINLSGSLGNLVFRRMPNGTTVISRKPDFSGRTFSQGQLEHQNRFKQAAAYAREAAKREAIYTELAERENKPAYNIALSDWFHPPVIRSIERKGGSIRVRASDNVMVTEVTIKILDEAGEPVEQGQAQQADPQHDPERWEYPTDSVGKIEATACDLAGNRTSAATS